MRKTFNRILQFIREKAGLVSTDNSGLEIEDRRQFGRRSIEQQVGQLWDAHKKPPRLDRLLQKLTTRTRKDEDIQRAKEAKRIRNSAVKRLSDRPEYNIIVDFFKREEVNAYFSLRHPEEEKSPNISLERFSGQQDGKLELIEKFRLMVTTAIAELEQDRAREEMKENALRGSEKRE